MKNKPLKSKIESIVLSYVSIFKDEYAAVVQQLSAEREKNKDKFASVAFDKTVNRKIYEIPETLHNMILNKLDDKEIMLMREGEDGKDFARWFATRFPEFASSTHI